MTPAPTAVQQAYDALLAFVRAAPDGSRLPAERSLAVRLDVSRSTLRTAVDRLVRLGYLSVRHGAGTIVRRPTAEALALPYRELLAQLPDHSSELFELRRILEPRLAGLAARRRSAAEVNAINMAARSGGRAFYLAVARASSNAAAAELVGLLVSLLADRSAGDDVKATAEELFRQQRFSVAAAIEAGDSTSAREAMITHLRASQRAAAQLN